ncbi:uncharacterized protein MONOS_17357 [Monocercomonoides exilis]|uniref:uncharacterized protein n=1 Tax=Monocercomonoides exilis TaxID=2049356 RepID=UPI00355AC4B1|nr:hypothetical protein MONOS_17357 [Monocercomonoides exilis]
MLATDAVQSEEKKRLNPFRIHFSIENELYLLLLKFWKIDLHPHISCLQAKSRQNKTMQQKRAEEKP